MLELAGELVDGRAVVVCLADAARRVRLAGLGVRDAGRAQAAALRDLDGHGWALRRGGDRARLGHVEDVELAACGRLLCRGLGGVVRDVVAVHDVVVPVALAGGQSRGLEAEVALPGAGFGGIFAERELARVVVPGAEEVDCLDVGGGAEGEGELDGGHCGCIICDCAENRMIK